MSELTRHWGQVFVINLPTRRDRHAEMGQQLRKVGLHWGSPGVTHFAAVRPGDDGGFRSIGAHGCYRSHLGALEQAIASGAESVMILEDDCNFADDIGGRVRTIGAALAATDWSFFYGGYHLHGKAHPRSADRGAALPVTAEQPITLAHCFAVRGQALRGLPAYLRQLMSRPAGDPSGGKMDVDGAYTWYRRAHPRFKTYIAAPEMAYQRSSRTDISALSWRDRVPVVRDLVAAGRRLRNLQPRDVGRAGALESSFGA
jgi:glycosyl transferase, family 25